MRLIIVRHGDPDYEHDWVTEKGQREVDLLAAKLKNEKLDYIYCSPLGRARATALPTLAAKGLDPERDMATLEWLREFNVKIKRPDVAPRDMIMWDWLPEDFLGSTDLLDKDDWLSNPVMAAGNVKEQYEWVTESFDQLLAEHGYVRDGLMYRAEKPNADTIILFCHFGVMGVLASHLLNVSPMIILQGMCALPSSVTTFYTEERRAQKAVFRMSSYGDTSHLYAGGEPVSFAARFCEVHGDGSRED